MMSSASPLILRHSALASSYLFYLYSLVFIRRHNVISRRHRVLTPLSDIFSHFSARFRRLINAILITSRAFLLFSDVRAGVAQSCSISGRVGWNLLRSSKVMTTLA